MIENEENLLLGQIAPSGDIVGSLIAEKGAKGDPGEPGEPGQDGQAATIQVGTVTTGEPGTQAIVENVGTESEAIFNFTIPRGADGSGSGSGDMLKSVYDANNNNIVDNAEKVNNHTVESDVPSDAVFTDTTYTAGTGIDITNGVISNTQTSAEWGNITGTLSNQTDLQNALDSKANSTHTHSGNDITTGTTYYGTASSGGASYSTVVFDNTVNIVKGDVLFIKWNIAQTGGNLKMNTNGSPSIPLMYKGSQITDNVISVGDVSEVVYDGTYFQLLSINKWIGNVNQKQDTLVSGTNIKTINGESILGGTDINTCKSFKLTFVDEINHIAYYKCNVGKQLIEGDSFLIKIGNVSYGDSSSAVISFDDGQNYYGIRDTELENIELSSLSNSIVNFIYRTSIDYGIYFEINKENIPKNEIAISPTEPTTGEEVWIETSENLLSYDDFENSKTESGVTFTNNNDGTVSLSGTATANVNFKLFGDYLHQRHIEGNYISGGINDNIRVRVLNNTNNTFTVIADSKGNSVQIDKSQFTIGYIEMTVFNGTNVDGLVIKPMMTNEENNNYVSHKISSINIKEDEEYRKLTDTINVGLEPNNSKVWIEHSKNLCNMANFLSHGGMVKASGENIVYDSTGNEAISWSYNNSNYYITLPAGTYTFTLFFSTQENLSWSDWRMFDSSNTQLKATGNLSGLDQKSVTLTFAQETSISLMFKMKAGVAKLQIETGNIENPIFEPYLITNINVESNGEYQKLTDSVNVGLEPNNSKVWVKHSKNYFDINNFITRSNGNATVSNGSIVAQTGTTGLSWSYANSNYYITLPAGTYTFTLFFSTQETQSWGGMIIFSASEQNLLAVNDISNVNQKSGTLTLTQATAIGVMIKMPTTGVAKLQIENGSEATPYEPYVTPSINVENNGSYDDIYSKPKLLFKGSSNGAITLNEEIEHFKKCKIFYKNNDGVNSSEEIQVNPNETNHAVATLSAISPGSNAMYQKISRIFINGKNLTINRFWELTISGTSISWNSSENRIYITEIWGIND